MSQQDTSPSPPGPPPPSQNGGPESGAFPITASSLAHLRVFLDVGRALTSALDLPTILRTVLEQMEPYFRPESWSLLMVDDSRHDLYYVLARGKADDALQQIRIPLGSGTAGWVALHGEPLITANDGTSVPFDHARQPHSAICLPLRARARTLGVLQLAHLAPQSLSDEAITFLYILCDYAAIAIENARAVARIQDLTITDDTTRLFNARHLAAVLANEVERARRFITPLSLLFLDLDHFKQVNDAHGHAIGSGVLAEFADLMRRTLRSVDLCFRYGGDEFVALLPQTGRPAAAGAARRLLTALRAHRFPITGQPSLRLSASVGVASYPEDATRGADLLELADARMYQVKHSTRDGVAESGPEAAASST